MKMIDKLAYIASVALLACACEAGPENFTPGDADPENCARVYFDEDYNTVVEVEPGVLNFELAVARYDATEAISVGIYVKDNENDMFTVPEKVEFAEGEDCVYIPVTVSSTAAEGTEYALQLSLTGEHVGLYTDGISELNVTFVQLKWESIGTCYWVDNIMAAAFGPDYKDVTLAVEVESVKTADVTRYRFSSPFTQLVPEEDRIWDYDPRYGEYWYTEPDEDGVYSGYPDIYDEEVLNGNYTFVINVYKDGVAELADAELGFDWGYGTLSTGMTYYLNKSYPLGSFDLNANAVVFPKSALYFYLEAEGAFPTGNPSYLFLSKEDYLNWYNQ